MSALLHHLRDTGKRPISLAKELGVTPSTITRIIRGERKPGVALARRIADATGVEIWKLRPDLYPPEDASAA
jgi:transcriptional regulator with XRE-family HTH domain